MTVSETKLLPCPFCGGEPQLVTGGPGNWYVRCTACKAATDDAMRDRASQLWNTRALTAALSDQVVVAKDDWRTDIENAPKDGSEVLLPLEFKARAFWCADLKTWVLSYPFSVNTISRPKRFQIPKFPRAMLKAAPASNFRRGGEVKSISTYEITVRGFPPMLYSARSPSKARARCWRDYGIMDDRETRFRDFLSMSSIKRVPNPPGIGERIMVSGLPATRCIGFGQYTHFMRDDSDTILLAHPSEVSSSTLSGDERNG